jgi:hypothetical protein
MSSFVNEKQLAPSRAFNKSLLNTIWILEQDSAMDRKEIHMVPVREKGDIQEGRSHSATRSTRKNKTNAKKNKHVLLE